MPELDVNRNSHLIDPHLDIWGWEIAVYLYLGGMAAGIMVFTALAAHRFKGEELSRWIRWLPFAAPILISLGMFLLFLDLEAKHHVYRFYLAFKPAAPMSWGSWILLLIYPATVLFGLASLNEAEAKWIDKWPPLKLLRDELAVHEHVRMVPCAAKVHEHALSAPLGRDVHVAHIPSELAAALGWAVDRARDAAVRQAGIRHCQGCVGGDEPTPRSIEAALVAGILGKGWDSHH